LIKNTLMFLLSFKRQVSLEWKKEKTDVYDNKTTDVVFNLSANTSTRREKFKDRIIEMLILKTLFYIIYLK